MQCTIKQLKLTGRLVTRNTWEICIVTYWPRIAVAVFALFGIWFTAKGKASITIYRNYVNPQQTVHIRNCDCWKVINPREAPSLRRNVGLIPSSCSIESTLLGSGQKVVSFSLYGEDSIQRFSNPTNPFHYIHGVRRNLMTVREKYPGWIVRLYTNVSLKKGEELCELSCAFSDINVCDVNQIPKLGDVSMVFGMVWRFLPIGDPLVDIFVSRDLDSEITDRERAAVKEWEESNKTFHFMRDHIQHATQILGGMWGAKVSKINAADRMTLQFKIMEEGKLHHAKGDDQSAIAKVIYSEKYFGESLAHDSFYCGTFSQTECQDFPTTRQNGTFVAMPFWD